MLLCQRTLSNASPRPNQVPADAVCSEKGRNGMSTKKQMLRPRRPGDHGHEPPAAPERATAAGSFPVRDRSTRLGKGWVQHSYLTSRKSSIHTYTLPSIPPGAYPGARASREKMAMLVVDKESMGVPNKNRQGAVRRSNDARRCTSVPTPTGAGAYTDSQRRISSPAPVW